MRNETHGFYYWTDEMTDCFIKARQCGHSHTNRPRPMTPEQKQAKARLQKAINRVNGTERLRIEIRSPFSHAVVVKELLRMEA